MHIISLKPNTTLERATVMFRERFRQLRHGRLRLAFDFYVPFRLFNVTVDDGRKIIDSLLAIDASTARLDLVQFDAIPTEDERRHIESERPLPVSAIGVDEREAFKRLEEKMTRSVFMKGFFRLTGWRVSGEPVEVLYMPYWVGVYERQGSGHLEVINALQGRFEGAKLRELVAEWFQPQQT